MNDETIQYCVGIDLGGALHQVCIIQADGELVGRRGFDHSGTGLQELLAWLQPLAAGQPATLAVALEHPRGALVEALLERGYGVWSINPKQLDRFRDRFSMAGAKDDSRDAWVLADSLRTDRPCFRQLAPDPPGVLRLRELSRASHQTEVQFRRAANQLYDALYRYFPSLLTLCSGADEPWLWDLLTQAPLPATAARLHLTTLEKLLRRHRIRRFAATTLQDALRTPPLPLVPGSREAIVELLQLWLPRLRLLYTQKRQLEHQIDTVLEQLASDTGYTLHADLTLLRSLPGLGRVFLATLLSEASVPLAHRDYRALRALAGVAPVTKQSGKTKLVSMRQGCNQRLRLVLHQVTGTHLQYDPRSYRLYAQLRARRHNHARALRAVADRLLAVVISVLKHQTPYDAARRQIAAAA